MADKENFASLLRQFEREQSSPRKRGPQVGDKVRGKVVSIGQDHVFIDLGAKSEGAMDVEELTDADGQLSVAVGDAIEAVVIREDEQTGTLLLGGKAGRRFHGGEELEHAFRHRLHQTGFTQTGNFSNGRSFRRLQRGQPAQRFNGVVAHPVSN